MSIPTIAMGMGAGDVPDAVMSVLATATVACAAANAAVAVADWRRAQFVVANSSEVGVASTMIPYPLKMAGAVGLIAGLTVSPWLGLAAAVGLVLFFVGAVAVHVRTAVWHNIAFPLGYLGLAVAAAAYFAAVVGRAVRFGRRIGSGSGRSRTGGTSAGGSSTVRWRFATLVGTSGTGSRQPHPPLGGWARPAEVSAAAQDLRLEVEFCSDGSSSVVTASKSKVEVETLREARGKSRRGAD
ncbi:hypothetical protein MDUV_00050 [Mycolicibacterium duvalii]|uniref:DoxX family protein n=1 Tax=Mycolicibacterium duvalii TaxID=39688 RepID=A0A7I7JTJ4_9MYCO|nr:hypothetical protein MDUV_00050 [Mycolicibacterium duvalii]